MIVETELIGGVGVLGVTFFATGPGLGLIMYIFTTLEFPTYNFDFHLLIGETLVSACVKLYGVCTELYTVCTQ